MLRSVNLLIENSSSDHTPSESIPAFFQASSPTPFRQGKSSPLVPTVSEYEMENHPLPADDERNGEGHTSGDNGISSDTNEELVIAESGPSHPFQKSHSRRKRSEIHSQTHIASHNGATYFQCNYCSQKYKQSGGTKNVRDHLKKVHGWDGLSSGQLGRQGKNQEVDFVKDHYEAKDPASKDRLEYLYVRYTVNANVPFSQVENPDFRTLLEYVNPAANKALPNSHNTIRSRVMELYQEGKHRVALILQAALSSIHITCDAWTTPNHIGAWGIVSHFTSEEGILCELLLSLSEQQDSHSGFNQAQTVLNTLTSYNIRNRLGYFVLNNAYTNDALMEHISADLESEAIIYNARQHRLRCNGQIIDMAVSAFLFGKHPEAEVQAESNDTSPVSPSTSDPSLWRKMGPLGKLYNIIIYITASTPRTLAFSRKSGGYVPQRADKGRWLSWYTMLDWSLTNIQVGFYFLPFPLSSD